MQNIIVYKRRYLIIFKSNYTGCIKLCFYVNCIIIIFLLKIDRAYKGLKSTQMYNTIQIILFEKYFNNCISRI